MKLYRTKDDIVVEAAGGYRRLRDVEWDEIFASRAPAALIRRALRSARALSGPPRSWHAPIGAQEIWAAGVTYFRSRTARMKESKDGGSFYDKVYSAERPELFFKATPHRVIGSGGNVRIRADSHWNVPEPELTLAVNRQGRIFGYTVGNDMSSRDIEGANPLYLPQAKVYDGSAALGPGILVTDEPLPGETAIQLEIRRGGRTVFAGKTQIDQIRRPLPSLVDYLFRDNRFPAGCFLMTGTGIVPPDNFTLRIGDEIRITIAPIGELMNIVT